MFKQIQRRIEHCSIPAMIKRIDAGKSNGIKVPKNTYSHTARNNNAASFIRQYVDNRVTISRNCQQNEKTYEDINKGKNLAYSDTYKKIAEKIGKWGDNVTQYHYYEMLGNENRDKKWWDDAILAYNNAIKLREKSNQLDKGHQDAIQVLKAKVDECQRSKEEQAKKKQKEQEEIKKKKQKESEEKKLKESLTSGTNSYYESFPKLG